MELVPFIKASRWQLTPVYMLFFNNLGI